MKSNVIIFYADDLGWQDRPLNDLGERCKRETDIYILETMKRIYTLGIHGNGDC